MNSKDDAKSRFELDCKSFPAPFHLNANDSSISDSTTSDSDDSQMQIPTNQIKSKRVPETLAVLRDMFTINEVFALFPQKLTDMMKTVLSFEKTHRQWYCMTKSQCFFMKGLKEVLRTQLEENKFKSENISSVEKIIEDLNLLIKSWFDCSQTRISQSILKRNGEERKSCCKPKRYLRKYQNQPIAPLVSLKPTFCEDKDNKDVIEISSDSEEEEHEGVNEGVNILEKVYQSSGQEENEPSFENQEAKAPNRNLDLENVKLCMEKVDDSESNEENKQYEVADDPLEGEDFDDFMNNFSNPPEDVTNFLQGAMAP